MSSKAAPPTTLDALTSRDDTSIEDYKSSQSQLVTMGRLKEVIIKILHKGAKLPTLLD